MNIQTVTSSAKVREILNAAGYSQKVAKKDVQGTWIRTDGKIAKVGMSLSSSYKTSQSSIGSGASWVYRVVL